MLRLFATHQIRKQTELSGCLWDFATVPEDGAAPVSVGRSGEGAAPVSAGRSGDKAAPVSAGRSGDKAAPVSMKMPVPGCWENAPETVTWRGKACYERTFYAGGNIRLEFKGVSHTAEVFLDGEKVVSHYNAYTPFEAVVRGLPEGQHQLRVLVDNAFGPDSALHVENDYQTYGGITRAVALEELGKAFLTRMHITPVKEDAAKADIASAVDSTAMVDSVAAAEAGHAPDGGQWTTTVEVGVRNLSEEDFAGRIRLCLGSADEGRPVSVATPDTAATIAIALAAGEEKFFRMELTCPDVREWNPETPVLYTMTAVLENVQGEPIDDLIDRFGFREVSVSGKDILLNGKKLKIKGFCRHEDHPQFGCALPFAAMQQDLMLMKDLGANSVRTSHYPNDELFLDLCDEQGFLVWEENHARGLSEEAMRNPNFERQCEDCIREMIEAHYNHPSIYIWGILNECASHTPYGRDCYQKQLELIRRLDGTRPCSFASCQFKTDICFDLPDVVSYNIYPLWYHDTPPAKYLEDLYQWVQTESEGAGKPFLITEVGAGGIYGYRTPAKVKWSEEYQVEALEKQLTAILENENVSGVYVWQFCDCRVCDSWFGGRPRTMNNKGVVDEYRRPKLAYEVVKRIYRG